MLELGTTCNVPDVKWSGINVTNSNAQSKGFRMNYQRHVAYLLLFENPTLDIIKEWLLYHGRRM